MLVENKKIAIIGGGPGGLTLARLLQQKGADVQVYERDLNADARIQGATLDLHYTSGLKAIKAMGLIEAFKNSYRPGAEKGLVMDKEANIVYDEYEQEDDSAIDFDSEKARPEIDRSDLRTLLLNALKPDTVVWNSHLKTIVQTGDTWELQFKNGTSVTAALVIGADGANSKIRKYITPLKPFYAGVTILQGNVGNAETAVPDLHQVLKGGKIYIFADEKFLHLSSKGDGSIDFYVSCKKEENWLASCPFDLSDRSQLLEWARTTFPGWNQIWFELFEKADLPLLIRPQYCIPYDQTWEAQPTITLLGDAAHSMPPSGEGVNLAMLDALELSENLTSGTFKDLKTAIASYEKVMRERASEEAQESMDMKEWMHAEGAQDKIIEIFS